MGEGEVVPALDGVSDCGLFEDLEKRVPFPPASEIEAAPTLD
jgi:hypothetical protein